MAEAGSTSLPARCLLWKGSWSSRALQRPSSERWPSDDVRDPLRHQRRGAVEARHCSEPKRSQDPLLSSGLQQPTRRSPTSTCSTREKGLEWRRSRADMGEMPRGNGRSRGERRTSRPQAKGRGAEEERSLEERGRRRGKEETEERKGKEGEEEGLKEGGHLGRVRELQQREERKRQKLWGKKQCQEKLGECVRQHWLGSPEEGKKEDLALCQEEGKEEEQVEQFNIIPGDITQFRFTERERPTRGCQPGETDCQVWSRFPGSSRAAFYEGKHGRSGGRMVGGLQSTRPYSPEVRAEHNGRKDVRRSPERVHDTRDFDRPSSTRSSVGDGRYRHATLEVARGGVCRGLMDRRREAGTPTKLGPSDTVERRNAVSRKGVEARSASRSSQQRRCPRERLDTPAERESKRKSRGEGQRQREEEGRRLQQEEGGLMRSMGAMEEIMVGEVSPVRPPNENGERAVQKKSTPHRVSQQLWQVPHGDQRRSAFDWKEMPPGNWGEVSPERKVPESFGPSVSWNAMRSDGRQQEQDQLRSQTHDEKVEKVPESIESDQWMENKPSQEFGRAQKYELPTSFTQGTFCVPASEAATSSEKVQDPSSHPGEKNACGFTWDGGMSEVARWVGDRIDRFFFSRCKVKPTGRVFPIPTTIPILQSTLADFFEGCWVSLRLLVVSLNSLNGEGCFSEKPANEMQVKVLRYLAEQLTRIEAWKSHQEPATWTGFFRVRTVDYLGEEVKTAQMIEWRNISPALPDEVGGVQLQAVVELGCRHYVDHFAEYLVPPEDQVYTKPPKVMVPQESWDEVCEGLLQKGICSLIAEEDVYRVQGKLLLNGLFGVSKGEFHEGAEVMRLIMNLIPLNQICKGIEGDVATLPTWAGMSAFQLHPYEDLVISSEDVRCFFYIFRVPETWSPFLAFNKPVSDKVSRSQGKRMYLCSRVLPMGFKNSVSLAQHVHRYVLKGALKGGDLEVGFEGEIRKDRPFSSQDWLFRIYLDNFDELRKVNRAMAEAVEGKISPLVSGLREEYLKWGIPRHPKKSVQQLRMAEVQGALVDGQKGLAFPKPEKILKYSQLASQLLETGNSTVKQAQVVGGGFVYLAMFRRPLLGSLNAIWRFILSFEGSPPFIRRPVPPEVKLELARFIGLVPLAYMDFRCFVSSRVTASDASEYGGGVCVSRQLTPVGCVAAQTKIRGDVVEPTDVTPVLTIGLFDGIGALRVAADALGWTVLGHISVECDAEARRVLESQFPQCVEVADVTTVTAAMVKDWAAKFSQVAVVVIGAGPPCQGVSGLNADRKGALRDHRSSLFLHVPRVRQLVKEGFPWAQVRCLMESVASMDKSDRKVMSQAIGCCPWSVDAASFSLARRPRLYWLDCYGIFFAERS